MDKNFVMMMKELFLVIRIAEVKAQRKIYRRLERLLITAECTMHMDDAVMMKF